MRGLAAYLSAGLLAVLATCAIASLIPGVAVGARSAAGRGTTIQWVDRTHKSDRLDFHSSRLRQELKQQTEPSKMLAGCEPVFSPLAVARAHNFAGRCLADADLRKVTTG